MAAAILVAEHAELSISKELRSIQPAAALPQKRMCPDCRIATGAEPSRSRYAAHLSSEFSWMQVWWMSGGAAAPRLRYWASLAPASRCVVARLAAAALSHESILSVTLCGVGSDGTSESCLGVLRGERADWSV
jgi:hypothetical protein